MALVAGSLIFSARFMRDVVLSYQVELQSGDVFQKLQYGSWPALSNASFFEDVKNKMIEEKVNFVEVDLSTMKLRVYEKGSIVKEVIVLSKGREGSWWETPAGLYKIESKAKEAYSSFGRVYMPWSMPFQGNFFIHGWPYYPDGNPVGAGYSGGCVRLSDEDAKNVYELVKVGTPVLVYEKDFGSDNFVHRIKVDNISARSYLAADLKNNFVFLDKSINKPLPIGSITKLMTALVATEYINIENSALITGDYLVDTPKSRLWVGQKISVFNLLYPLLLESSNESATAISDLKGQSYFVKLMNDKTKALGMPDTQFEDASGISGMNISTAEDLFALAKYLLNNRSFILKISSGNLKDTQYGSPIFGYLNNLNILGDNSNFIGGASSQLKNKETDLKSETVLAVISIKLNGEDRPVTIIILDSENATKDADTILNYILTNY
jgi:hypothetical protein